MRNKKVVRLTESQLHNIIAESVNQILNEISNDLKIRAIQKRRQQAADSDEEYNTAVANLSAVKNGYSEYYSYPRNWRPETPQEKQERCNYWRRHNAAQSQKDASARKNAKLTNSYLRMKELAGQ